LVGNSRISPLAPYFLNLHKFLIKMRSSALNTMFTSVLKESSATTAMHKLVLNCTIVISYISKNHSQITQLSVHQILSKMVYITESYRKK